MNPSISPSLQSGVPQRKLEEQKENLQTKLLGKPVIAPANPVKISNPAKAPYRSKPVENGDESGGTDGENGKSGNFWDQIISFFSGNNTPNEKPKATPQIVPITTVEPKPRIPMTPTPKPTATPSPTPTMTPSLGEQQAQAAVDKGMKYADEGIRYKFGSKNIETGAVDCSGFVVTLLTGAGFKFGKGNLSLRAEYMAGSFLDSKRGDEIYNYSKNNEIPPLKPGDLIFSADADDLETNEHVTMATGNGLQVVEASGMKDVMKVTYLFDAYKTYKNGKYYRDSQQVVTQVIRPFY